MSHSLSKRARNRAKGLESSQVQTGSNLYKVSLPDVPAMEVKADHPQQAMEKYLEAAGVGHTPYKCHIELVSVDPVKVSDEVADSSVDDTDIE